MSTLHGTPEVPFSVLFADTVKTHGLIWAHDYYVKKHGMQPWEWFFWLEVMWRY